MFNVPPDGFHVPIGVGAACHPYLRDARCEVASRLPLRVKRAERTTPEPVRPVRSARARQLLPSNHPCVPLRRARHGMLRMSDRRSDDRSTRSLSSETGNHRSFSR